MFRCRAGLVAELHARAAEFRGMAATARTAADAQGLTALGARYDALASRRDHEVGGATSGFAPK